MHLKERVFLNVIYSIPIPVSFIKHKTFFNNMGDEAQVLEL